MVHDFIDKAFRGARFPWCKHAPKVFTRYTKNRAPEFQILSALIGLQGG